jgi:fatty-acyl-CoA synthase
MGVARSTDDDGRMPAMCNVATVHDIETTEAQPMSALDLPPSTYALFERSAQAYGNSPALTFFADGAVPQYAHTFSYRGLFAEITRTANLFETLGVGAQDVVAYILPNLPETHFVLWGGEAAGIVFAINPLLEPAQMAELLQAAGARVLVTLAPVPGASFWGGLAPLLDQVSSLETVLQVDLSRYLLLSKRAALKAWRWSHPPARAPRRIRVLDFHREQSLQPEMELRSGRTIAPEDLSSFFGTGGTTGAPKIAMRRHANEIANTVQLKAMNPSSFVPGKVLFCGLPLFHVNAALVTGLAPFSAGGHVILATPQGYRGNGVVKNFWRIVERYKVNFFSGVPTIYSSLLQVPIDNADISSLEYGLCGAAPMPVEVFRAFEQRTGVRILEGYGLTEGACVSSSNPPLGERRIGAIGLRLPWQAMKAVLLDERGRYQRDCGVDEVGAIAISGPNVFAGYRDPVHDQGLWIDCGDGRRWLNTGDLGRQDAEGYFWLTGRKKELIIRGGHNIDPASIEAPMHCHPAVALCAAVGRPDRHAGELPVAYVQLKPGASADTEALLAYAAEQIPERAAVPKMLRVMDQLPQTAVGKIFKPELRAREIRDVVEGELRAAGVGGRHTLEVVNDSRRGMTVIVTGVDASEVEALRCRLGAYTFSSRVEADPA